MGWGVGHYPQPKDNEPEFTHCENYKCGAEIDDEDDIAPGCEHPKCSNNILCVGCSYDCADCKRSLCVDHVCETPLPDHSAIYRCHECQAKVDCAVAA